MSKHRSKWSGVWPKMESTGGSCSSCSGRGTCWTNLPRAEVNETFTQTTVEMVALSAEQDLTEAKGRWRQLDRVLWGAAGSGLVIAAAAGYFAFAALLARPNEQLVRDLPVIEHVEQYEVADSVEFLRQLENSRLFEEEASDER